MIPGIYLGHVHKAGGSVGPDSYVIPLRQLDGLNMESGRTPEGKRPNIEQSDQVYSNILDATAGDQSPQFPLREACEKAATEVRSVTIPTEAGEAAAVPDGPQPATGLRSDNTFNVDGPAVLVPPPPRGGEGAPRFDSEADLDDDGPG
eukprot:6299274-Pyramimonas_sp.AAC.1